jgi:hypothetical protein
MRAMHRWKNIIKMHFKQIVRCYVEWTACTLGPIQGSCERDNGYFGLVKGHF